MESEYIISYLSENHERMAAGQMPLTPGSFLAYNLHGRRRKYMSNYNSALHNAIDCRLDAGTITDVVSAGGQTAYIWVNDKKLYNNIYHSPKRVAKRLASEFHK